MERGNPNTFTDGGAAAQLARTAAEVAGYNVLINLPGLRDEEFVVACKQEVDETLHRVNTLFQEVDAYVQTQLRKG